jgi:PAS domain S-box-containing protein
MDSLPESLIQRLRLAAIVESSDDAIVGKDVNGIITSWNAAAERMFGYTAAEAVGQSIRIIIPEDRQSEEDMVLSRVRRGERVDHFETERCRRNGERIDVSITVSPMRTPDGQIIGASKIARDISDRKRAERALAAARAEQAELRQRLSTIINASGALLESPRVEDVVPAILLVARQVLPADATAVWQTDNGIWRVTASHGLSDAFTAKTVVAPIELVNSIGELLVLESSDDPRVESRRPEYKSERIASMLGVPLHVGKELVGSIAFYYRTPRRFTPVQRESAIGLGRLASAVFAAAQTYDSQRRRRFESEFIAEAGTILVSSLEYHDTLARLANRLVPQLADWCAFHLHSDEGLERVAISTTAGIDRDRIDQFLRALPEETDDAFSVDRVVRTGVAILVDDWSSLTCVNCAQERRAAAAAVGVTSVAIVPLVARGRTLGALTLGSSSAGKRFGPADVSFAQDLAYRTALSIDNVLSYEEARTANRLKDEFLANLSHELRTPLNAIVGYAQMLKKGAMPEEKKSRAYEVLDKNASALTQIVEDVLDISRIVSGKIRLQLQPVVVAPIVIHSLETVQSAADAKGVHVAFEAEAESVSVAGDADRLQQVFWNLLSNAVKFTPRQGNISVRVHSSDGVCQVVVADNGTGIDPKFLPHIFERFRQGDSRYGREHGGLGLGLAIARQIVEMHGGTISAESPGVGQGATFRVVLPSLAT